MASADWDCERPTRSSRAITLAVDVFITRAGYASWRNLPPAASRFRLLHQREEDPLPEGVRDGDQERVAVVDLDLARRQALRAGQRRELEDELLAVEGDGALARERLRLEGRPVGS